MIKFTTTILKFAKQGEKTGWTYIHIPAALAQQLCPGNKKSFRVKGSLDTHPIKGAALLPMGEGDFILPLNGAMRKGLGKSKGALLQVVLSVDKEGYTLNAVLLECLEDEPEAMTYFTSLPRSHQNYYSKWIESAKTDVTKTKRIAIVVNGLAKKMSFAEMLQAARK